MADDPDSPSPDIHVARKTVVVDAPHAPIIFFDEATNFAAYNGIISVTLAAVRSIPDAKGGIANDQIVVAFLRSNMRGAKALRDSLDRALLLAEPKPDGPTN
jgi:hypothetical protein